VIDFSVLKETIGKWIDEHWDHTFIVSSKDADLIEALYQFHENKPLWIAPFNPTAENMANYLLKEISPRLLEGTGVEVYKIELYETENCKADAILAE
jgi:6-pyruvoyltetrahydropterin/6-carboxytetrahydropterin synthase